LFIHIQGQTVQEAKVLQLVGEVMVKMSCCGVRTRREMDRIVVQLGHGEEPVSGETMAISNILIDSGPCKEKR
jgi:hypothetical protein